MASLLTTLRSTTTTFTPTSISGLLAWFDFATASTLFTDTGRTTGVTADGDAIKGVTDRSGTANHLSSATGCVYKTGIQNGLSVSRYNGTTQQLLNTMAARSAQTVFAVLTALSAPSASSKGALSLRTGGNGANLITHSTTHATNYVWAQNQATADVQVGIAAQAWHVVAIKVTDASTITFYGDGTQSATFDPNDVVTTGTGFALGVSAGIANGDYDIGEVLVYDSALSDTNRNLIEAYLKAKWGTP